MSTTSKFIVLAKPLAVKYNRVEMIDSMLNEFNVKFVKHSVVCDSSKISRHYSKFIGKKFFKDLVEYYTGKNIFVYECEGTIENIDDLRAHIGMCNIEEGSFRDSLVGEWFAYNKTQYGVTDNGIHCSDSVSEGEREYNVWFGVPPTSERTKEIHTKVWNMLSTVKSDCLQYAGGEHDGTAVGEVIDLDYRILTSNIQETCFYIEHVLGLKLDKVGVDNESNTTYYKYEIEIENGKCDVAVVDTNAYRYQVSKSHIIHLCDENLKTVVRNAKLATKHDKTLYKQTKKEMRNFLLSSVNFL